MPATGSHGQARRRVTDNMGVSLLFFLFAFALVLPVRGHHASADRVRSATLTAKGLDGDTSSYSNTPDIVAATVRMYIGEGQRQNMTSNTEQCSIHDLNIKANKASCGQLHKKSEHVAQQSL